MDTMDLLPLLITPHRYGFLVHDEDVFFVCTICGVSDTGHDSIEDAVECANKHESEIHGNGVGVLAHVAP